jgi:uncharacterized protein with FMN-binding domain
MKRAYHLLILLACVTLLGIAFGGDDKTSVSRGPVDHQKLVDGVYEGRARAGPNKAVVKVTIKDKRIAEIEIVKHRAWKGRKAEPIIPRRIIENQSTKVDAVSGATNSSRVIMNAVQKAIENAYQR